MIDLVQFTVAGVSSGAVFGLLALAWVLAYRVSGLLFFLVGEFAVLAALLIVELRDERGWPFLVAVAVIVPSCALLGLAVDHLVLRRARRATEASMVLVLVGLAILGAEMWREVFGANTRSLAPVLSSEPLEIGGVYVLPQQLAILASVCVLALGLWAVLNLTNRGMQMRACAQDADGAQLVGIDPRRVRATALAAAGALGAIAGCLLVGLQPVAPSSGLAMSLDGFIAAVVGVWSFPGALAAGIGIGIAEAYGAGYVGSEYKDIISLALLLVVLVGRTLDRQGITRAATRAVGATRRRRPSPGSLPA